ncbi:hypothetical protein PENANT_c042G11221 [Penicillium antarcticum]|uniref:Uncharacterized protein n=2 Tax=Penicillium antarcticum TaxID=416450 RepID=A0A1V6PSA5_9EURO|nr:hypothetical protein PENANT_c042G11221 [Penicillium antarcticum]
MDYEWDKINVFTRWVASTKQTIVIIFDPKPSIQEGLVKSLLSFDSNTLDDIYWPYPIILDSVANLEEIAVWGIRNQVRDIETKGMPEGAPKPEYRKLHDISRHAIHVSETLDVAVQTVEAIQKHHINLIMPRTDDQYQDPLVSEGIRARLEFYQGFISNLRHRSTSNEKRLQNEIQLAFNTVAQHNAATSVDIGRVALYNAETSVKIGRAAKIDSSAMKTIAFVTLIFLPPTYISSVFSMSFFQCGNDNGWGLSNKFWIYWVFAIPTTIATVIVWQYWHNLFPDPESNKPKNAV